MSTPAKSHNPGFLALVNDAKTRIREIGIDEYRRMAGSQQPHILVDVREDREWTAGHAVGAVHMSRGTIERDIEQQIPDKRATLVLYCGLGGFGGRFGPNSNARLLPDSTYRPVASRNRAPSAKAARAR